MSASRNSSKDSTPPPLLLMAASEGLTMSPAQGTSLLMPVPQKGTSLLFPDEEDGEVDSFLGQPAPPPSSTSVPLLPSSTTSTIDNFPRGPAAYDSCLPPMFGEPSYASSTSEFAGYTQGVESSLTSQVEPPPTPPMSSYSFHRPPGPPRYAPPPSGTYAPPPPSHTQAAYTPPFITTTGPQRPPLAAIPPYAHTPSPLSGPMPSGSAAFGGPATPIPVSSASATQQTRAYTPVVHHWFYCRVIEARPIWQPFSFYDSELLEGAFLSGRDGIIVSTNGGRFDVNVTARARKPVYWTALSGQVTRASWFFKSEGDARFMPYDEIFAEKLEFEYKNAIVNNSWHKRLEFAGGETIVMHNPGVIVHFTASSQPDEWGTTRGDQMRPRVVRRGIEEFLPIPEGETGPIDHVMFLVHGIGSTCDLKFRGIVECVDDFRAISQQMVGTHFRQAQEEGRIGRVEYLPVRWHSALHGDATDIDSQLKSITLSSIGKLRSFTNDTLLDVFFYSSPTYAQHIADAVTEDIQRLYDIFLARNPDFNGTMSVAGHSLGSLILFDLLAHQRSQPDPGASHTQSDPQLSTTHGVPPMKQPVVEQEALPSSTKDENLTLEAAFEKLGLADYLETFHREQIDMESLMMCDEADLKEMGLPMGPRKKLQGFLREQKRKQEQRQQQVQKPAAAVLANETAPDQSSAQAGTSIGFLVGTAGAGEPLVRYRQLAFRPTHFFMFGSPVAMFLTVRGGEPLGPEFHLPTCPALFNIFHPFDPVAYRMEPLLLPHQYPPKPIQIPHHKGRKRLHLELRDSLSRVGTDLKQRIVETFRSTWKSFNDFALAHKATGQQDAPPDASDNDVCGSGQMPGEEALVNSVLSQLVKTQDSTPVETMDVHEMMSASSGAIGENVGMGKVNEGRRVDFVLQEAPLESFNDYLFALGSHLCYWESEDTILLVLKEIYSKKGIAPVMPNDNNAQKQHDSVQGTSTLAPPPLSGFVRSAT